MKIEYARRMPATPHTGGGDAVTAVSFDVTIISTIVCLAVAEAGRLVRKRDVNFFFGVVFTFVAPLFYTFAVGSPFHQSIPSIAIGLFDFWRWWKHRDDDDDDDRGRRLAAWVKSRLPKPDSRPAPTPR